MTASPKEAVPLTPLGEACSRRDLTAIHEMLETVGYKDDEGVANEVSGLSNPKLCKICYFNLMSEEEKKYF